jgi:cell division protein FtsB
VAPQVQHSKRDDTTSTRRKAVMLFSAVAFIALVVGSFLGDGGMLALWEGQARAEQARFELEELRAQNERLADEIRALRSDPRAIERIAREELGLAAPGEVVFVVRTVPGPPGRP